MPRSHRVLKGRDYFILWSSLGVGLLVLSAGSFLSEASFLDASLAIVIGSIVGSFLLALAGRIGSDHGITSIVTMRPSLGLQGSYLPAALNVAQLIGWTAFEIMIMAKAAEILTGGIPPFYFWAAIFGAIVAILGIAGPLTVARQWLGKFAVWIVYGTSIMMVVSLLMSASFEKVLNSQGNGMSFFLALDLVIAMPISWMPLVADYNRFASSGRSAMWGTFIGFAITNILFYFAGVILGTSDVVQIIIAVQTIFFGFLILVLLVHETDNAFADVYSAAVSSQNFLSHVSQRSLIVALTAVGTVMAILIPIQQYEVFILLIGAVFVPLFGVILADYYILKRRNYDERITHGSGLRSIGWAAILSWGLGSLVYYILSPLSPVYQSSLPQLGATLPSFVVALVTYCAMQKARSSSIAKRI